MIDLFTYNRHWESGYRYPYPKHRALYSEMRDEIRRRRILQISGLRRVGKSTLFFQLINELLKEGVSPFSIWYFTFDEEELPLEELLNTFSKQTEVDFKKEHIFVFLDEIQKLPNFQNQLKVYYDLYPNLKFFISGSTSLFIKKRAQESLAGRVRSLFLTPLRFDEYLRFKGNAEILDKPQAFASEIARNFEIFLHNQFIESLSLPDRNAKKEYYLGILKKIVFEDIPAVFPVNHPEILWQIVRMIAQMPGMFIDYRTLAGEVGLSNKTISSYLYALEESFLVKKLYNFSRNRITSEKKMKRFYLASPSLSWAMTDFIETGHLVENAVISLNDYQFFWRDPYHHEVDFVAIDAGDRIVPIEVKYKEHLQRRDIKNLLLFAKKFQCSQAIVLKKGSATTSTTHEPAGIEIIEKPVFEM